MLEKQKRCLGQGIQITVGEGLQGAVKAAGEDFCQVIDACHWKVGFGSHWHLQVGRWEPGHGVGDSMGFGVPDPDIVAAVVMEGWAQAPGILAMGGPGASVVNFFVGLPHAFLVELGGLH